MTFVVLLLCARPVVVLYIHSLFYPYKTTGRANSISAFYRAKSNTAQ